MVIDVKVKLFKTIIKIQEVNHWRPAKIFIKFHLWGLLLLLELNSIRNKTTKDNSTSIQIENFWSSQTNVKFPLCFQTFPVYRNLKLVMKMRSDLFTSWYLTIIVMMTHNDDGSNSTTAKVLGGLWKKIKLYKIFTLLLIDENWNLQKGLMNARTNKMVITFP